jgi:hypothetical protein
MARVNIFGYRIGVPGHPVPRTVMGGLFVAGGAFGFLPILGYWMIPIGLTILAIDFPPVRRFQRRMTVRIGNLLHRRWPALASRFGYGPVRDARKS